MAILAELSLLNANPPADAILTDAASGLAFSLAGLVAWRRRPENRVGPLMLGIGLSWFGGDFLFGTVPVIGPLSFAAQALARVLFAWLLLAFPSGTLGSTLHRWSVGLIGGLAAGLAVLQLFTVHPSTLCPCPESPFAFAAGWPVADQLDNVSAAVGMGMTVILVPLVVRRLLLASAPARRTLLPVLAGGAFSLLSVTPDTVARLTGSPPEPISWLPIVWMALPVGFLVALLDARMAQGAVANLILDLGEVGDGAVSHETVADGVGATRATPEVGRPSRALVTGVGLLGVAVGVSLVVMAYGRSGETNSELWAFLSCWLTLPYIAAGLIAWRSRPDSRLGPLMLLAGFGTYLNFLLWSSNDILFTIGLACQVLPPVLFLHVFLAYPTGRLQAVSDRIVVVGAYLAAALALPEMLMGAEGDRSLLALFQAPVAADVVQHIQLLATSVLMLAGIAVLVRRRLAGARPIRPAFAWLVDAFAGGLLMTALLLSAGNLGWSALQAPLRVPTYFVLGLAPIVFLVGLLQSQLVRASVGELLVDMGTSPGPVRLQAAVARALRDPSVGIVYWLPEQEAYADAQGNRIDLAPEDGRSVTLVRREGVTVAALVHDAALDDEPQLLAAVAQAVGMAIENSQLQVELQARLADVRASRARIVSAGDAERRRLERNLHDGAQQRLVALSLALRRARNRLQPKDDPGLATSLDDAALLVHDALAELRELARGLHPAILSEAGLPGALAALVARSPVEAILRAVPSERFPTAVEAAAYYLVSEALTNVAKHAPGAGAEVRVTRAADQLEVEVADSGPGGAVPRPGSGLQGLEDRMAAAGGGLTISTRPGGGTTIRGWIPLPGSGPPAG